MAGRIYEHFDVVIAGAGAAGVSAAVAASGQGARVCLLEKEPAAGGGYVQSGTTAFKPVYEYDPISGFSALCTPRGSWLSLDPEALQRFYYRRLREQDVLFLTSAWVMEATLENGSITQLIALTREGPMRVEGDVFIDATGDGDVAALCAVPYTEGREEDGRSLPPIYCFTLQGCGMGWESVLPDPETLAEMGLSGLRLFPGVRDGEITVMMLYDEEAVATSAIDRARADGALRAAVDPVAALLTRYSAFKGATIARQGARVVFPEGRHPQGRTILDSHDLASGTRFPDWVVANLTADIELPGMEGIEEAPSVRSYDIPYRALTPVRVKNLLLCGRCISGTHRAHGSFRALQPTLATGQAAGIAAYLAMDTGGRVQKVPVARLQQEMVRSGMEPPRWMKQEA